MTTDKKFFSRIVTVIFFVMILISCGSHEQKSDVAFERVKEEKMMGHDSNIVIEANTEEPKAIEPVKKIEKQDEWNLFKIEIEKKILINEQKIKEVKGMPNSNSKFLRNVVALEKENNDLRRQMSEYDVEVKLKWENFKAQINHDVKEISIELKDLKTNNKK